MELSGKIGDISSGISAVYQWYSGGIPMVISGKTWWYYQFYIGGIPVEYQWCNHWFQVLYQWKPVVKFGGITTDIN